MIITCTPSYKWLLLAGVERASMPFNSSFALLWLVGVGRGRSPIEPLHRPLTC